MSWIEEPTVSGICCDKPGCDAEHHCAPGPYFTVKPDLVKSATAAGWRMFVGRSQRWYCDYHGPTTTMRLVYPEAAR